MSLESDRAAFPKGVSGLVELDPLPTIPEEAAEAGIHGLILALAAGPPLAQDPYGRAKAVNFDRLLFAKMPIVCGGRTGLHEILSCDPGGLVLLRSGGQLGDDVASLMEGTTR